MTIAMVTDLQAERPTGEVCVGTAEQCCGARQVEARPAEVLQLVWREQVRGWCGGVIHVIVLQQLRDRTLVIEQNRSSSQVQSGPTDGSNPTEEDGGAVQDAVLWLHSQAPAAVTGQELRPGNLRHNTDPSSSEPHRTSYQSPIDH